MQLTSYHTQASTILTLAYTDETSMPAHTLNNAGKGSQRKVYFMVGEILNDERGGCSLQPRKRSGWCQVSILTKAPGLVLNTMVELYRRRTYYLK